jgi:ectoine hydroxylase-related dioxygenase (phytanoyl-CoA dioxygenase family)
MIRNPNREEFDNGKYLIYTNGLGEFKYDEKDYVAAEVKRGDAIVIDGLVVHRSSANLSPKSRHIYTFHVYESDGATFSKDNWFVYF